MNKSILLISALFILILLQTFGQGNPIIKIDVGGTSILIPTPENDFIEVGEEDRKIVGIQIPEMNNVKALFLLKEIYQKIGIKPFNLKRTVMIEVVKTFENMKFSEKDFIDFKTLYANSLSTVLSDAEKTVNLHYAKIKDIVGNAEVGKAFVLGTILDRKDANAFLIWNKVKTDEAAIEVVTGNLTIRIKNKILFVYVSNELKDDESLFWVSNTIQNYSQMIFDLNKEKLPE
jgi:hypothetical protein